MHPGVYNLKLDPDAARELVLRGAALIFLDVPEGTALGIDQRTFLVGPNFKGVKMVPPGMHAVSYASSGTHQGGFGPTTALFVHVGAGRIAAWRWQRAEETLRRIEDDDEIAALEKAVKSFQLDAQLAPYDLPSYATWQTLSGYISPDVVDAVAPVGGNINILAEAPAVGLSGSMPVTAAEIALEQKLAENREKQKQQQQQGSQQKAPMGAEPENSVEGLEIEKKRMPAPHAGRCFFTPLPRLIKRAGLSPGELTALNLDKSAALHEALAGSFRGREDALLGEFQFAFLAFLLGHSLEGFAQWKSFLSLMFGCYQAVEEGSLGGLFAAFLRALQSQLDHALTPMSPSSSQPDQSHFSGIAMVEELLNDSALKRVCTRWLRWALQEAGALPAAVTEAARRLSKTLEERAGWDCGPLQELRGTFAPRGAYGGGRHGDAYRYYEEDEDEDEEGPVLVEGVELNEFGEVVVE